MIGRLTGKVIEKQAPDIVLDVNGVGYELQLSLHSYLALPDASQTVSLHTHLVVREDAQLLYGFIDGDERALFRALIKVNGVGPKMALGILSTLTPAQFVGAVQQNDISALVKIPGVGKKTAERLAIEMRDKLSKWQGENTATAAVASTVSVHSIERDAESALIALGYKPQEATKLISAARKVCDDAELEVNDSEVLIRQALKLLVKNNG